MTQVTISLETDVASAFLKADPQMRKKAETLLNIWLKELFTSKAKAKKELFEIMQTAGKIAQTNGLTPEILERLLNEKD